MLRAPSVPEVAAWFAAQSEELLYVTAVGETEVLAGIEILPDGRRRIALERTARDVRGRL